MPLYRLIKSNVVSGETRHFEVEPPVYPPAKGFRWLPDTPPSFNPHTQTRIITTAVSPEDTSVPYTVSLKSTAEVNIAIRMEQDRRLRQVLNGSSDDLLLRGVIAAARMAFLAEKGRSNWTAAEIAWWNASVAAFTSAIQLRARADALEATYAGLSPANKATFDPTLNSHWT